MRALLTLLLLLAAGALLAGGVKVPLASAGKHHPGADGLRTPWRRWHRENPIRQQHVVGMRIPRRYFVTKGGRGEQARRAPSSAATCCPCRQLPAACRLEMRPLISSDWPAFCDLLQLAGFLRCPQALGKRIRGLEPTHTRQGRMT